MWRTMLSFCQKFDFIAFQKRRFWKWWTEIELLQIGVFSTWGCVKLVRRLESWKLFFPFLGLLFCNGKCDTRSWMDGYNQVTSKGHWIAGRRKASEHLFRHRVFLRCLCLRNSMCREGAEIIIDKGVIDRCRIF